MYRITVDADIDEVWDVVRDVTRVGEWSHECVGAEWLGGVESAVPGARFRGRNRAGLFRWGRVCAIVAADPYELMFITVPTAMYPDSSEWRITLTRADRGTRIAQQFPRRACPTGARKALRARDPGACDRTAALAEDMVRLGTVARALTCRLPPAEQRASGRVGAAGRSQAASYHAHSSIRPP